MQHVNGARKQHAMNHNGVRDLKKLLTAQLCPELMTLAHARSQMSVDVNHISQDILVSQFYVFEPN